MRQRRYTTLFAVIAIGILFVPVFLLLAPYVEQSATEARRSVAFNEVQRLHKDIAGKKAPGVAAELSDLDPWGRPYRVIPLDGGAIRVLSSGPNETSPPTGPDNDDIYSDMPVSPDKMIQARKKQQWLIAMIAGVNACVLAALIYFLWRRHASRR